MFTQFFFHPFLGEIFTASQLFVIISALFLVSLSVKALKNTGLKKISYLIIAFALFAIQHIINYVNQIADNPIPDEVRYPLFAVIEVAIMAMFILAILKK